MAEQIPPIVVDFDYTLTLESIGEIADLPPNVALIERLKAIRQSIDPVIKIVTARGNRDWLSLEEKQRKYLPQITKWLQKHGVPYDLISFNKEEGRLFVDDMTIGEQAEFWGMRSEFTGNKFIFTASTVIKMCSTALMEHRWYRIAERHGISIPALRFTNQDCITMQRITDYTAPTAAELIPVLRRFKEIPEIRFSDNYETYLSNIPRNIEGATPAAMACVEKLTGMAHGATFFHGDLSTTNVLCTDAANYLIDPNCKHIFGSYLTDAGKAAFSLIAYEAKFPEAQKIADEFGPEVWYFAVAEGLRVCKYRPKYVSIVNNIADWL